MSLIGKGLMSGLLAAGLALAALVVGGCDEDPAGQASNTPVPATTPANTPADTPAPPATPPTEPVVRVLLVLTNHGELGDTGEPTGFYLPEASHPWSVFTEAGYEVTLASPLGGSAPIDPRSMEDVDAESEAFLEAFATGGVVERTASLSEVDFGAYRAVFFAGGHGTMWDFAESEAVKSVAESVYGDGGVVAAVCHGPAALVGVMTEDGPLLDGKRVTGFTNAEEGAVELTEAMPFLLETRMRDAGAEFVGAGNFEANVVVDGRLVTGQNPASAKGAAEAVVKAIEGE